MTSIEHVRATIRRYNLLKRGETVVIGVSGGPDSLALLYILAALKKEFSVSLHVAHLDHALRKTSAQDRKFVAFHARKLELPFTSGTATLRSHSEEAARKARFDFFFTVCAQCKASTIALGHTRNDQAETVLMRLIRGTGLLGLAAIAPVRSFGRYRIIRPLIDLSRGDIEKYLKRRTLTPRIDETNRQDIFLRNRIRRELLPLLEKKYNPNITQLLSNTARNAGSDYDFLIRSAEKVIAGESRRITLSRFHRLHPAIQRMVLRLMAERVQGDTRRLTTRHIREIEDMAHNRPIGSIVNLPKNVSVKKTRTHLYFYRP